MISRAPTAFSKSATGSWEGVDRKYEVQREGLRVGERFTLHANGRREVSFFAWPEKHAGADGPEYTWVLGATSAAGKISIGFETYAILFNAFSKNTRRRAGFRQEAPASSSILISNLRCGTSGGRNRDNDCIRDAKLTDCASAEELQQNAGSGDAKY
jgi:hypothetical protein